jgi:hypothetical protein
MACVAVLQRRVIGRHPETQEGRQDNDDEVLALPRAQTPHLAVAKVPGRL